VKITGVVRGLDGQPAAGSEVLILGSLGGDSVKTDAKGKFEMVRSSGIYDHGPYCLIVRDPEHNLAAVVDIDEDTGPLDILLAPAMTIVGRAECDGKPVTNATAALLLRTGRIASIFEGLPNLWVGTNRPGHFEIPALPPGERYGLKVSAPGYGGKLVNIAESDEAKRVEIEPVQLRPANLKLAGQVLDAEDKPVSGAHVSLSGKDQPYSRTRTDREGHFRLDRVCEGSVQLSAEARRSHGAVAAEGGDTNVVIQLGVVDLTLSWRQNGRR